MIKKSGLAMILIAAVSVICIATFSGAARAEEKGSQDANELAKQSQNPVSTLISVPFENNATFNNGPEDAYVNILNIKPVVPMSLTESWNLINRVIVPVIYQDERFPGEGDVFGLGDITYQGFLSPAKPGKLIWGIGRQLPPPPLPHRRLRRPPRTSHRGPPRRKN